MTLTSGAAIYLIFWWLTLFMVLPFGIRRVDDNDLLPGEDPGAPSKPRLMLKFAVTTGISLVLFAIFYVVYESGWVSFRE